MAVRKGFTLIEFLIGTSIGIVIIGALVSFFFYGHTIVLNKSSPEKRKMIFVFQVMEIINSDLRKAGYNVNAIENLPVECNSNLLTIRYVDYDKEGCENKTFEKNDDCSYIICYYVKDKNLKRVVDKKADGCTSTNIDTKKVSIAPMFDENIIEIDNFTVKIDNSTHIVKYVIKGRMKGRESSNFTIEDAIICKNWHH